VRERDQDDEYATAFDDVEHGAGLQNGFPWRRIYARALRKALRFLRGNSLPRDDGVQGACDFSQTPQISQIDASPT
jgi:hypothetical protein